MEGCICIFVMIAFPYMYPKFLKTIYFYGYLQIGYAFLESYSASHNSRFFCYLKCARKKAANE